MAEVTIAVAEKVYTWASGKGFAHEDRSRLFHGTSGQWTRIFKNFDLTMNQKKYLSQE
ncbi:hypothetical protein SAY87_024891 [Trapa incisa]|uniref:Uncharacterized protein n=1 Tax=Trapa incisa TaxID=236973 RepID=A0AAN7GKL2_9MYRT|nr:hypothetical protein SAY87_024891 [Trapa incisa]